MDFPDTCKGINHFHNYRDRNIKSTTLKFPKQNQAFNFQNHKNESFDTCDSKHDQEKNAGNWFFTKG
jgi:hypothetical protein